MNRGNETINMELSDPGMLIKKKCVPCRGGIAPLTGIPLNELNDQISDWSVIEEHHILKTFKFKDFKIALEFVYKVGNLAETEWHHPDINLSWGKVDIKLYTHKIDGLSLNDFIMAAKIDELLKAEFSSQLMPEEKHQ